MTTEKRKEYDRKYRIEHRKERSETERKRTTEKPWVIHFAAAKARCTNPNRRGFQRYGGNGIKFLLTMDEMKTLYLRDGAKDMKRPSIDRIYHDGNYVFGNCRFIELSKNSKRRYR